MREKIINASIKSLRQEGLKFSVDLLAKNLKISKKTVYKYFPDKEALALALYEKYYDDSMKQAQKIVNTKMGKYHNDLLYLYYDSIMMSRNSIFNKYMLNDSIYSFVSIKNDELWKVISVDFSSSEEDLKYLRLIIDGTFEKLCNENINPDIVIERLVKLL